MKHDRTFLQQPVFRRCFLFFPYFVSRYCLFLHSGNHGMNCRPPILLSNKPTFITRHAKQPQELSQQFKSSLLLITVRFLIQMPTFHLPARFLMKLTVSHTILLRMLFHSREALSDTQELSVKLKVLYPSSDTEPFIEILQWKTGNTASWTPDTHQPVYKGAQS